MRWRCLHLVRGAVTRDDRDRKPCNRGPFNLNPTLTCHTTQPLTNGYKTLIPRLLRQNITRILVLSTPSYRSEPDTDSFEWKVGIWTIRTFCPGAYQEVTGIGEFVSSLRIADGVRWTVFRVGGLTNGAEEPVKSTYVGSGEDGFWISRASVARWVLEEVIENKWVGRTPYICN